MTLTVKTAQEHFMSTLVYSAPVNCMIKSPKQHHQSSAFCGTAECAPENIARVTTDEIRRLRHCSYPAVSSTVLSD